MNQYDEIYDEQTSLISPQSMKPSPDTLTKLVKRLKALATKLLPVEVDAKSIDDPTSRIITPKVISAFSDAAGDFVEALPYCLLRAHAEFMREAYLDPADFGENSGRAVACEVLARRIIHQSPSEKVTSLMSTRHRHREPNGDISEASSALEIAIDTHCTIFLSSTEAQSVVRALWDGELVQTLTDQDDIQYVSYHESRQAGVWGHMDPSRISVPRYQNFLRIVIWFFFLAVYSQAVREPLERLDPNHTMVDIWEVVLYVMALAFSLEDILRFYKLFKYATYRAFGFWNAVAFITDSILLAAFLLRIAGLYATGDHSSTLRLRSFQVLSFVAPFIWIKLITIFDGYQYVGTMQICVARMLQESGIFFALLSVLGIGFLQGLYALDAADGLSEDPLIIVNVLVQGLLQSPNYDRFSASPVGLALYYLWNVATAIILLNVLISLFSSAYADVVNDAEAEYMTFYAAKTVAMIRAPDSYIYPAPFNLVEFFFVAPFEIFGLQSRLYAKLNRVIMGIIFFVPLTIIALFETSNMTKSWMVNSDDEVDTENPDVLDPVVEGPDADQGSEISKIPFDELVKRFPNTEQSMEATIIKEIKEIRARLEVLTTKVDRLHT
ncbi:uncharacterized protein BJ212DRAFT_230992 [Suillus subaureus]|uniref:Ion transport domain-containing protein n=1 Tax=Suillus subaureus TaxID=48587 RepID=A0A9P7JD29_9AGAM|nr:uncharacterized protein BJ212DRAFT_230992 [Suillus subaureus]KAG1815632.1 hypothetical protein BJ212DRAFT_230992 [Suillus subaureus]